MIDQRERAEIDLATARRVIARCLERARSGDDFFVVRLEELSELAASTSVDATCDMGTKRLRALARSISATVAQLERDFNADARRRAAELQRRAAADRLEKQRVIARLDAERDRRDASPALPRNTMFDLRESGPG